MNPTPSDLEPVTLTSWGQLILVAPPSAGFKTAADLVAAAKARPGKLNYASPGVGTPHHMSMELLKQTAGVHLTHIPYRGTAPAVTDLLGGQVDAMFLPIHVALPHVKSGRLLALGIGSDKRHPLMPDVPTFKELGVDWVDGAYRGIGMPKSTPPEARKRISDLWRALNNDPEMKEKAAASGFELVNVGVEEMDSFMASKTKLYTEGAARMGLGKK